jgi:AcrR family transcriptional regulator
VARIAKKSGAYHHGDLRRVLLEAAVRVIDKEGVDALSLNSLAKRAGVSAGAPYHHFESRDQLLAAIAAEGFERLIASMRQHAGSSEQPLDYLRGLGVGYIKFALAHPGHFRVMFRPEVKGQLRAATDAAGTGFGLLIDAIARCQAAKLVGPGDPFKLVLAAWSAVHGAAALWIDGPLAEFVPDGDTVAALVPGTLIEGFERK